MKTKETRRLRWLEAHKVGRCGRFNSIQFNLFPAHINISYNIDNVHIMCRKRGGLKTVLMNVHPQTLTVVNY